VYTTPIVVRGYECGLDRTVSLPVITSYFEHARWGWILRPDFGLVEGLHTGHFFVVQRQVVGLVHTAGIDTRADVRAALRLCGRVHCEVDQDLVRADGVLLARGRVTGVWIGPQGRPVRIPDATRAAVSDAPLAADAPAAPAIPADPRSYLAPPLATYDDPLVPVDWPTAPPDPVVRAFRVRRSDCDMFAHVNGANYLRWFEDALDASVRWADLGYAGEARAGDPIEVWRWPLDDGAHALQVRRDGEVLCRAVVRVA
jgi:acyl-CoA thioesterase FadM